MYNEIVMNLKEQLSLEILNKIKNKTIHIGIFTEPCLSYMLDGKKTIESRFTKKKQSPYEKITKEDIVLVKKSGGNIVAYFTIKEVLFYDLHTYAIEDIKTRYNKELCVDDAFWENKRDSQYATLMKIDKLVKLKSFPKKGIQTGTIFIK